MTISATASELIASFLNAYGQNSKFEPGSHVTRRRVWETGEQQAQKSPTLWGQFSEVGLRETND